MQMRRCFRAHARTALLLGRVSCQMLHHPLWSRPALREGAGVGTLDRGGSEEGVAHAATRDTRAVRRDAAAAGKEQ